MNLGRVVGTVVSTRKDERLAGFKLLVVRYVDPDGRDKGTYVVAVDTVDAGFKDLVLVVTGSSARMAAGCQDRPVDAAIVGVVDSVELATPAASVAVTRG
jgi:microcompartment protein CcmK/EutM